MLYLLLFLLFGCTYGFPYYLWGEWNYNSERYHDMKIDISEKKFVMYSDQNLADFIHLKETIWGKYILKSNITNRDLLVDIHIYKKTKSISQFMTFDSDIILEKRKFNIDLSGNIIDLSDNIIILNCISSPKCKKYSGISVLTRRYTKSDMTNNRFTLFWIGQVIGFISNHILSMIDNILDKHN